MSGTTPAPAQAEQGQTKQKSGMPWALSVFGQKTVDRDGGRLATAGYDASERVLLALDCANESRLGPDPEVLVTAQLVVNVDHHHDNSRFGDLNLETTMLRNYFAWAGGKTPSSPTPEAPAPEAPAAPKEEAKEETAEAAPARKLVESAIHLPRFDAATTWHQLAAQLRMDSRGVWKGIDVDVCRAVAAAVFGDHTRQRHGQVVAEGKVGLARRRAARRSGGV